MAGKEDYYSTLGLSKGASADQIKQAYRKLAREYHPDMVEDSKKATAEAKFKEINEAYQILSDPQKKQQYDQFGHAGVGNGAGSYGQGFGGFGGAQGGQWGPFSYSYSTGGTNGFNGFDPFDIFEEVFGFRGANRQPRSGKHLRYEMEIDFVDTVKGAEKEINIESGKVKVKIPAGVSSGTEIKFPGKGMPGPSGLPPGDLYLTFRIKTPKEFRVVGSNIGIGVDLDFADAVLGTSVQVPVVDPDSTTGVSNVTMKIPGGTQHGQQIRLKGKGMPDVRGRGRGDAIVQIFITMPTKLSKKQKQILEEYREI